MSKNFEFKSNADKFKQAMSEQVSKCLTELGMFIEAEADDQLNKHKPRRVDTGNLRESLTNRVNENEKSVTIGTNVKYGIYVHEGTKKMEPNRFLKNAIVQNEGKIKEHIEKRLKGTAGTLGE